MSEILTPQAVYDLIKQNRIIQALRGKVTPNFGWNEVFWACSVNEVLKCPREYFDNALEQAHLMEEVRVYCGNHIIIVHRWYSDPEHNARIGGARLSQHLKAKATDWHLVGHESVKGNRLVQDRLNTAPFMKKRGLEYTGGKWTHTDSRSEADGKKYGYRFHR